jgi:4-amino-4-deoxy-L-arabinose transferase-like glycosyltransferase
LEYFYIIVLILSIISFIYFAWKTIRKRNWRNILGLAISSVPLILTFIVIWIFFIVPNRQRHSNDKEYFGEYEFYKTEGNLNHKFYRNKQLRLKLKPDFTYNLTNFDEPEFPSSGKWQACWTDDCQFGFNYDKPNFFVANQILDSPRVYLKLRKSKESNNYFIFRKTIP